MSQCLTLDQYNAGNVLCGFSYGILGHPVYTLEQRRKILSDADFNSVLRWASCDLLPVASSGPNTVHCEHCGHLA